MLWKRPILIGGLGLSATLWLLDTLHFNLLDGSTLFTAMALGSGVWWWRRYANRRDNTTPEPQIEPPNLARVHQGIEVVNRAIAELEAKITDALSANEQADLQQSVSSFRQQAQALLAGLDRRHLAIAIVGAARTGKTHLLEHLVNHDWGTDGLTFTEFSLPLTETAISQQDACLWLTDGDLTESVFQGLQERVLLGQQTLVVFNKQDQYLPSDRDLVIQQLLQRVQVLPMAVPVVAIAAHPNPIKVRQHQPDGTVKEWLEPNSATLESLHAAVQKQLQAETAILVMATTLRQIHKLHRDIQTTLNQLRRRQAMPLVEQMQWVAAATAFANPVPTLDLLATLAINSQLIVDVGKVYGFSFSLEEAKTAATTLAQLMVKLGLVEVSTQALSAVLKSHVTTYVAGGVIQGLSAAYLTRMAGQSLIEYFEAAALAQQPRSALSLEAIGQHLQRLVQPGQQAAFLGSLVQQGLERFRPGLSERQPATSTTDGLGAIAS